MSGLKAVLLAIGVVVLIGGLTAGSFAIQWATADVRGTVAANEAIKANAQFRIEAYERFFNQCASVQTIEATLAATREELATGPTPRRQEQLNTNITALSAARADAVNQYNADARKSYTAGQFRSNDLPFQLPPTIPNGGTSCVA